MTNIKEKLICIAELINNYGLLYPQQNYNIGINSNGYFIRYNQKTIRFSSKAIELFQNYKHKYIIETIIEFILWNSIRYHKFDGFRYIYGDFIITKNLSPNGCVLNIDIFY